MVKKKKKSKKAEEAPTAEKKTLGRVWSSEEIDFSDNLGSPVSLLSWNILAQRYVRSSYFPATDRPLLTWKTRRTAVVEQLKDTMLPSRDGKSVQLACLQEVDRYTDYYLPELRRIFREKEMPLRLSYKKRTSDVSVKHDGSCVIYAENRFNFIEEDHLEFNDLSKDENLFGLKKLRNLARPVNDLKTVDYFLRDCVAAVCVLEDQESGQKLLVASAHLFWDPECTDIKLLQAMLLLKKLDSVAQRHDLDAVLVGGDFNSLPNSAVIELLTKGAIGRDHREVQNIPSEIIDYINNTLEDCVHVTSLLSAYTYDGKQPGDCNLDVKEISTLTRKFNGNLDYILYRSFAEPISDEHKIVTRTFTLPTVKSCHRDRIVSFPAFGHPSDHLPLISSFSLPSKSRPT